MHASLHYASVSFALTYSLLKSLYSYLKSRKDLTTWQVSITLIVIRPHLANPETMSCQTTCDCRLPLMTT
jgi:hypothetical protein